MVFERPDDLFQGDGPRGPGVVLGTPCDGRSPPPAGGLRRPREALLPPPMGERRPALLLHHQRPAKRHLRSRAPRREIGSARTASPNRGPGSLPRLAAAPP